MRWLLVLSLACLPAAGQMAEPILTEFAAPLSRGEVFAKIGYSLEHLDSGALNEAGPMFKVEAGATSRMDFAVAFPLLWTTGPYESLAGGGGKLAVSTRVLLFGGGSSRYAVSAFGVVEAPTGNRRLVGDATEVAGGIFADRTVGEHIALHSNVSWGAPLGGSESGPKILEFRGASVWLASRRVLPVFEIIGSTNTCTGRTALAAQPEFIFRPATRIEVKAGPTVGLKAYTPDIGVRVQVAFLFGGRR